MVENRVVVEPLSDKAFANFGQVVTGPKNPPSSSGAGWQCWFGEATLHDKDLLIGQVLTTPGDGTLRCMERHPNEELLVPITGSVLQALCQPGEKFLPSESPHAGTCRLFRIEPGQAIVIAPGVWHAPAYSEDPTALYFFTGLRHDPEPGRGADPWVPFANDEVLNIALK